jgi:hypothetical protein
MDNLRKSPIWSLALLQPPAVTPRHPYPRGMAQDSGIPVNRPHHPFHLGNIWSPRTPMIDTKARTIHIPILPRRPPTFARVLEGLTHRLPCRRLLQDIPILSKLRQKFRLLRTANIHLGIILLTAIDADIARMFMNLLPLGCNHPHSRYRLRTPHRTPAHLPAPGGRTKSIITRGWDPPQM